MKILIVSNMYPSDDFPHYGVFVKNTEEILRNEGFLIDKVVMKKVINKYLKGLYYLLHYIKILFKSLFLKYDVIYVHYASHNAIPIILSKFFKKSNQIYTNVHGSDVVPETGIQKKLQIFVKKLLKCSTKVIVPSNYFLNYISEEFSVIRSKICVFPSGGVCSEVFFVDTKEEVRHSKLFCIGYVGRIDKDKGWDDLLSAFNVLRSSIEINLKIVGSGKLRADMLEQIQESEYKSNIQLHTMMSQRELRRIYNEIDLFIFPTKRIGESLGLVGLEAMACGTPVIGSKIGGLQDYLVEGVNGLFFEPGNIEMLSNRVLEYINYSDEKKREMINNSINTSKRYDVNSIKRNLLSIFQLDKK